MDYEFWEASDKRIPVGDDIEDLWESDPGSAAKLVRKLETLDRYSFDQLKHSKTIEHINRKIWTLRYDLRNKICRIYFKTDKQGTMQLLHLVIKKERKLKPKDIETAEQRAKTIL